MLIRSILYHIFMYNNYKFNTGFSISYLNLSFLAFLLSVIGSLLQISGCSWDVTSHLLNEPESFFTSSHTVLYSGICLLSISAIIGFLLYLFKKEEIKSKSFAIAFKFLIFRIYFVCICRSFGFFVA